MLNPISQAAAGSHRLIAGVGTSVLSLLTICGVKLWGVEIRCGCPSTGGIHDPCDSFLCYFCPGIFPGVTITRPDCEHAADVVVYTRNGPTPRRVASA